MYCLRLEKRSSNGCLKAVYRLQELRLVDILSWLKPRKFWVKRNMMTITVKNEQYAAELERLCRERMV